MVQRTDLMSVEAGRRIGKLQPAAKGAIERGERVVVPAVRLLALLLERLERFLEAWHPVYALLPAGAAAAIVP